MTSRSLLNTKLEDFPDPVLCPTGTVLFEIDDGRVYEEKDGKPARINFQLIPLSFSDDVDPDEVEAYVGEADLSELRVPLSFRAQSPEDGKRITTFFKAINAFDPGKTLSRIVSDSAGLRFWSLVSHTPNTTDPEAQPWLQHRAFKAYTDGADE